MQSATDAMLEAALTQLERSTSYPPGYLRQYVRKRRTQFLIDLQRQTGLPRPVHVLRKVQGQTIVCPGCQEPGCRWDAGVSDEELATYDHFVIGFSGGKDSIALALYLLERGVPREKIELWHHDVDGREGSTLFDWKCTRAYCQAFADALGLKIYYSWRLGGLEREMLRENQRTAPMAFEVPQPDGSVIVQQAGGTRGELSTRLMFPQVSADLSVRWCSASAKIDVGRSALNNQERFLRRRTMFLTGERAEESTNRAGYRVLEPHHTDNRAGVRVQRHVDAWRPVHGWPEAEVWAIMGRWRINPHPAYRLGFGRVSCAKCIFSDDDQWASSNVVDPAGVRVISDLEKRFGKTIHRKLPVLERVARGTPYAMTPADLAAARSEEWREPILLPEGAWKLPAGAFGDTTGPT